MPIQQHKERRDPQWSTLKGGEHKRKLFGNQPANISEIKKRYVMDRF